jgi:hypothetical protein
VTTKRFSKATFTDDIDSRIRQAHRAAGGERKGSAKRQVQEGIVGELQKMRVSLVRSPLTLD